jgi:hypothetical protein
MAWRFRQTMNCLIVLPTLYLTLQYHPQARLFALVALGRNHGRSVVKAMEIDREARRKVAIRQRSLEQARPTV